MIGSGLVRFHPFVPKKQGGGSILNWREIKASAPKHLKDVLVESAAGAINGLKTDTKTGKVNWKGGLKCARDGAKRAVKRKVTKALTKSVANKRRRDIFGV